MPSLAQGEFRLENDQATARLGAAVGRALRIGEAVCLWGPLGAGKSTLARGLIRALTSPEEEAPSPTFTLAQLYETPALTVTHFDLYRLGGLADVAELGLDEALDAGAAVIEWPERLEGQLPRRRLDIALSFVRDGEVERRLARLTPQGDWEGRLIEV